VHILGPVHVPHFGQLAPAPGEFRKARARLRHYLRAAPRDAIEKARRHAPQRDQRVAAVLGGREYGVGAAGKPARAPAQVARAQRRTVRTDEDHAIGAAQAVAQGIQHARTEIRTTLAPRPPQLHRAGPRRVRRVERARQQSRVQARRPRLSQKRNEARFHASSARLAREDDDPSPRIGAPAHPDPPPANKRAAATT
jgi:hypothetical protein